MKHGTIIRLLEHYNSQLDFSEFLHAGSHRFFDLGEDDCDRSKDRLTPQSVYQLWLTPDRTEIRRNG